MDKICMNKDLNLQSSFWNVISNLQSNTVRRRRQNSFKINIVLSSSSKGHLLLSFSAVNFYSNFPQSPSTLVLLSDPFLKFYSVTFSFNFSPSYLTFCPVSPSHFTHIMLCICVNFWQNLKIKAACFPACSSFCHH